MRAVLAHSRAASSSELLHCGALLGCGLLYQLQKFLAPADTLHHDRHHLNHLQQEVAKQKCDKVLYHTPSVLKPHYTAQQSAIDTGNRMQPALAVHGNAEQQEDVKPHLALAFNRLKLPANLSKFGRIEH